MSQIPRIGITESLAAPGIAPSARLPNAQQQDIGARLTNAIAGFSVTAAQVNEQRLEQIRQQEAKQERTKTAEDVLSRGLASRDASVDLVRFQDKIARGLIDVNPNASNEELVNQHILEATQGRDDAYVGGYDNAFGARALQLVTKQAAELREKELDNARTTASSAVAEAKSVGEIKDIITASKSLQGNRSDADFQYDMLRTGINKAVEDGNPEELEKFLSQGKLLPPDKISSARHAAAVRERQNEVRRESDLTESFLRAVENGEPNVVSRVKAQVKLGNMRQSTANRLINQIVGDTESLRIKEENRLIRENHIADMAELVENALNTGGTVNIDDTVVANSKGQPVEMRREDVVKEVMEKKMASIGSDPNKSDAQKLVDIFKLQSANEGYIHEPFKRAMLSIPSFSMQDLTGKEQDVLPPAIERAMSIARAMEATSPQLFTKHVGTGQDARFIRDVINIEKSDHTDPNGEVNARAALAQVKFAYLPENADRHAVTLSKEEVDTETRKIASKWFAKDATNIGEISSQLAREALLHARVWGKGFEWSLGVVADRLKSHHKIVNGGLVDTSKADIPDDVIELVNYMLNKYKETHADEIEDSSVLSVVPSISGQYWRIQDTSSGTFVEDARDGIFTYQDLVQARKALDIRFYEKIGEENAALRKPKKPVGETQLMQRSYESLLAVAEVGRIPTMSQMVTNPSSTSISGTFIDGNVQTTQTSLTPVGEYIRTLVNAASKLGSINKDGIKVFQDKVKQASLLGKPFDERLFDQAKRVLKSPAF